MIGHTIFGKEDLARLIYNNGASGEVTTTRFKCAVFFGHTTFGVAEQRIGCATMLGKTFVGIDIIFTNGQNLDIGFLIAF